jgi:chitinase
MSTNPQSITNLIVGYFPGWAIGKRNYHVSDIPADKLTHINYAFAGVSPNGLCESITSKEDQVNFPELQNMKQQWPNIKTLISIGGAINSINFPEAAKTDSSRQSLAQSCVSFMVSSGFDGIDIDWEFPGSADRYHYTALLEELRNQLDAQGTIDNMHYLLTAALPASPNQYARFELDKIHQYLDWINLMAYEFYTAKSRYTHFSAPLYPSPSDPDAQKDPMKAKYNVDSAIQAYQIEGIPQDKIVVGVPFYGRGWMGVPDVNNGLYQTNSGPAQGTWGDDGVFDFKDLEANYLGSYERFWHDEASAPWLYNPDTGIMISYDDEQSLCLKANYVNKNKLAGIMIWQLSSDDSQSTLVNAIVRGINGNPNCTS